MEQDALFRSGSRVWDERATEVIAEARKLPMGEGDVPRPEKRVACGLPPS